MDTQDLQTTEWGAHGQNVQRLIDTCKRADELGELVFSGNNDSKIPEYLAVLNNIRKQLHRYMSSDVAEYYKESFANAINFVRAINVKAQNRGQFINVAPFKKMKEKDSTFTPVGLHSLLPFLFEADQHLGELMERIGLGFKASSERQTVREEESLMMGLDEDQVEEFYEYIKGNKIIIDKKEYKKLKGEKNENENES